MKKMILLSVLTASSLMAAKLTVAQGTVQAHTEVFGDSMINPGTSSITSHLTMEKRYRIYQRKCRYRHCKT